MDLIEPTKDSTRKGRALASTCTLATLLGLALTQGSAPLAAHLTPGHPPHEVAPSAGLEKPNLSPEGLRKLSTHVVQGQVRAIYTRERKEGDWDVTHHVAEVQVKVCEKGEGLTPGDLVYARYWTRTWDGGGPPPPSTNGHRGLPTEGQTLRLYLAQNAYDGFTRNNTDGGFNVIGANGFERLPEPAGRSGMGD